MNKKIFFYGVFCYFLFFATFLYLLLFLTNFWGPKTIDSGEPGNLTTALIVNTILIALFGIQHSIMARDWFKNLITRKIPDAAERSTYVLMSCIVLIILYIGWQPLPGTIWNLESKIFQYFFWGIFLFGCVIVFISTWLIDHFELFGLKQVYFNLKQKPIPTSTFKKPLLYKHVRHPIYFGFLLILWATPNMTVNHLFLAVGFTLYIFIGVFFEERDLIKRFGQQYKDYIKQVPSVLPFTKRKSKE